MAKQWTPPADAIPAKPTAPTSWTPPSDAVPTKKKSIPVSDGTTDVGFGLSAAQGAIQEAPRLASSGSKGDGIYSIASQPNALYRKDKGQWFVDVDRSGKFQPLTKGDVSGRVKVLEAKSERYVDPDYERNLDMKFESEPVIPKSTTPITEEQKQAQKTFDTEFKVLSENDPIVLRREKVDKLARTASKAVFVEEEPAVDVLRKQFAGTEDDVFDFQEYGAGDKLRVENKNTGQYIIVDLDNSAGKDAENERKLLEAFIDVNLEFPEYNKLSQQRKELIDRIDRTSGMQRSNAEEELRELDADLRVVEAQRRGYALSSGDHMSAVVHQKYDKVGHRDNQKVLQDDIGSLSTRAMRLKQDAAEITNEKKILDDGLKAGMITPEQYSERINDPLFKSLQDGVKQEYETIVSESKELASKADQNDQLAAKAYEAMKLRGDAASLAIGSFTKGFTGTVATIHDIGKRQDDKIMPTDGSRPFFDESLSELLPGELTEEYVNNPDLPDWQKALAGISESLGAALSMGPMGGTVGAAKLGASGAVRAAYTQGIRKTAWDITKNYVKRSMTPDQIGLFINSYSNFRTQMDSDPAFADVPEGEKVTLAAAYGVVTSKLERFGLTKSLSKSPIGKNLNAYILKSVFSKLPKNASSEAVESAIEGSIKGLIGKGILNTGGAAIIEGSTEGAQEIADITLKSAYNTIKEKDYFDTPKTFGEALERTYESFKLGMIGGGMMAGVSQTLQTPAKIRTKIQMDVLQKTIENPDVKAIFENNLKVKVLSGEISKDMAKSQLRVLNESQALFEKIPSEVKNKYVPFQLLSEKQELESQIQGKDPSLVAVQKERIKAIDEELVGISVKAAKRAETSVMPDPDLVQPKTTQDADKKQSPTEVPVQSETGISEKVAEGKSKAEPEIAATESETEEEVTRRYKDPDELSDVDIEADFKSAILTPDTSGVKLKLSVQEQLNRGVTQEQVLKSAQQEFIDAGRTAEEAVELVQPILNEAIEQVPELTADQAIQEKTKLNKVYDFLDNIDKNLGEYTAPSKLHDITGVLPAKVMQVVVKALKVSVQAGMTLEQAIKDYASRNKMNESDITNSIYSMSEAQQKKTRERLTGERAAKQTASAAARSAKDMSKRKKTPIVVDEYKALIDVIKRESKAARDKKAQVKDVLDTISTEVKKLTHTEVSEGKYKAKKGKISLKQTNSILSALKGVNMDNKVMVDRFTDYVANVVSDAEFAEKVDQAIDLRRKIKKSFKGKSNPFVAVAKGFSELNPKWVEDIDDYLDIAEKVHASLRPTVMRGEDVTFKKEASVKEVGEYTAREQELQDEITAENIRVQYEKVTGATPESWMKAGDMKAELLALASIEDKNNSEETLDKVKAVLREKLSDFKSIVTKDSPPEIQEAVKVDLDILDARTAIRLLDALDSYAANESVSGLRAQLASYRGLKNVKSSTLKSRALRLAGSKKIGRFQNEQFTNMNILTERLFRGVIAGGRFRKESGVQDIVNGANRAESESTRAQNDYLKKFGKIKGFDSAENIFERNVIAFLRRNTIAGDTDAEFSRRKKLLNDSVSVLKKGNDLERKKGELYEKVLTKLGVTEDASLLNVESRATPTNIEAVDYITEMWSDLYPELSDFSLGVHNIMLPRDSNYTPDRFASVENSKSLEDQVDQNSFGFGSFNNLVLDKNEAGVLMESKKPKTLPKGKYVDLDFDTNMFRSYKLALTDMYTAEPIRQAYSYMNAGEFEEMVNAEDRRILQNAVSDYVTSKKGKSFGDKDTFEYLKKLNNFIASMGAARALAGFGQFINQYSTAMTNTFVNAGFNLRPGEVANKDAMEFINRSGRAIANRGVDVVTTIDKADTIVEGAKIGGGIASVTTEPLAKANTFMLKWLLSKPDVFAARASWLAYYRKSMKEQGLEVDYKGEVNDKAADYAQSMIDRNMDISDTELRGKFFRDKNAVKGFIKQIYFPFATFALNQKNRMWSDLSIATSRLAAREDRRVAYWSIAALLAEIAVYNGIRYAIGRMILEAALEALDLNDDEKEEYRSKYKQNIGESILSKGILDLLSPTPVMDLAVLNGMNKVLMWSGIGGADEKEFDALIEEENKKRYDEYKDPLTDSEIEKKRIAFYQEKQFQFYVDDEKNFGTMGIQLDKTLETYDMLDTWLTGEYTQESKFGDTEKMISKEGQDKLLLPVLMKTGAALVLPREADQMANRMYSVVKKKYGMTAGQSDKVEALKKLGVKIDDDAMKLIKTPRGIESIEDELRYMDGLNATEKKKYMEGLGL